MLQGPWQASSKHPKGQITLISWDRVAGGRERWRELEKASEKVTPSEPTLCRITFIALPHGEFSRQKKWTEQGSVHTMGVFKKQQTGWVYHIGASFNSHGNSKNLNYYYAVSCK